MLVIQRTDTMAIENRWIDLCVRLGIRPRGRALELYQIILEGGYKAPSRRYHTIGHVEDCLRVLDQYRHLASNPDAINDIEYARHC